MEPSLTELIAAELAETVDPRVAAMAAAIAALYPGAARAVLFYGSCLREHRLEGLMLDFYLIVSRYETAYPKRWLRRANRLLPPNVFPFEHEGLTAKYAVLSEEDFARECSPAAGSVSVWARFAQPSRLVWQADAAAREAAMRAIGEAAPTLFEATRPLLPVELRESPLEIFKAGFALTYGAELRAERRQRASSLVDDAAERYRRLGEAILREWPGIGTGDAQAARRAWRGRQRKGKALTVLRLVKASFTFAGGIDYLAWKINRHAGTAIEIKPWQRRWPLVAGLILLPRLLRRKAIR
jgi:hypothetical protein